MIESIPNRSTAQNRGYCLVTSIGCPRRLWYQKMTRFLQKIICHYQSSIYGPPKGHLEITITLATALGWFMNRWIKRMADTLRIYNFTSTQAARLVVHRKLHLLSRFTTNQKDLKITNKLGINNLIQVPLLQFKAK